MEPIQKKSNFQRIFPPALYRSTHFLSFRCCFACVPFGVTRHLHALPNQPSPLVWCRGAAARTLRDLSTAGLVGGGWWVVGGGWWWVVWLVSYRPSAWVCTDRRAFVPGSARTLSGSGLVPCPASVKCTWPTGGEGGMGFNSRGKFRLSKSCQMSHTFLGGWAAVV